MLAGENRGFPESKGQSTLIAWKARHPEDEQSSGKSQTPLVWRTLEARREFLDQSELLEHTPNKPQKPEARRRLGAKLGEHDYGNPAGEVGSLGVTMVDMETLQPA